MIAIPAPMLAPDQLRAPFTDPDWVYELKHDGYRCLAGIDSGQVKLQTKAGRDCTAWFPEIAQQLATLPGGPHVIDGEACVITSDGTSDFNAIQARARKRKPYPGAPQVTLMAFDLLVFNGERIMDRPLIERKALLEDLLRGQPKVHVAYVGHLPADKGFFTAMLRAGLKIEGVVAKRRDSKYLPGVRSDSWRKIKRSGWQEGRVWRS